MSSLSDKVKTALDETRTLILGAQILLGFQYQGVFQDNFAALSALARILSGSALVFMLVTTALLIAPSAFHRIAERGESTGRLKMLTGRFAAAALAPFAVALGLDITIALDRVFGNLFVGGAIGLSFATLASLGWYGTGRIMKKSKGSAERRTAERQRKDREIAPLHSRVEQMLTEARVILPGAQALLGFQLVIVLTSAFEKLSPILKLTHGCALLLVASSVILLITPAALHRIVWAGEDSEQLVQTGGRITVLSLVPLALGMAADSYVVFIQLSGSVALSASIIAVLLLGLLGLWFGWPLLARCPTAS
jgi:Family of unknown function (DUF6328)